MLFVCIILILSTAPWTVELPVVDQLRNRGTFSWNHLFPYNSFLISICSQSFMVKLVQRKPNSLASVITAVGLAPCVCHTNCSWDTMLIYYLRWDTIKLDVTAHWVLFWKSTTYETTCILIFSLTTFFERCMWLFCSNPYE